MYINPANADTPSAIPIGTDNKSAAKNTINITIPMFSLMAQNFLLFPDPGNLTTSYEEHNKALKLRPL